MIASVSLETKVVNPRDNHLDVQEMVDLHHTEIERKRQTKAKIRHTLIML